MKTQILNYRVAVISNVYENKPPFDNCLIIGEFETPPNLYEGVFTGSYDECRKFVKENCKNCLNCE